MGISYIIKSFQAAYIVEFFRIPDNNIKKII